MLKTKPLNALLAQSLSEHVASAILFTPSGNLLASATSPTSVDAKKARVHSALAANIWTTYESIATKGSIEQALPPSATPASAAEDTSTGEHASAPDVNTGSTSKTGSRPKEPAGEPLKTLTMELSEYNLYIQYVKPGLLLALIGKRQGSGHPSSSSSQHSNEGVDNDPSKGGAGSLLKPLGSQGTGSAGTSGGATGSVGGSLGVLKVTAQTLVDYLQKELKDFEPAEHL